MNILDRFRNLEHTLNLKYIECLTNLRNSVNNVENEDERIWHRYIDEAVEMWSEVVKKDSHTTDIASHLYQVMDPHYETLIKRDHLLFGVREEKTNDFLARFMDLQIADDEQFPEDFSAFLYDGVTDDTVSELWDALLGLYRLALLIDVISGTDSVVRDLIELVLANNPNINSGTVLESMTNDFKKNKRFRRLLLRLLNSDFDEFEATFSKLIRVISTLSDSEDAPESMKQLSGLVGGDGSNINTMAQESAAKAEKVLHERFVKLYRKHDMDYLLPTNDTVRTRLFHWIVHTHTEAQHTTQKTTSPSSFPLSEEQRVKDREEMTKVKDLLLVEHDFTESTLQQMVDLYADSDLVHIGSLNSLSQSMKSLMNMGAAGGDPENATEDQTKMFEQFKSMLGFDNLSNEDIEQKLKHEFEKEENDDDVPPLVELEEHDDDDDEEKEEYEEEEEEEEDNYDDDTFEKDDE